MTNSHRNACMSLVVTAVVAYRNAATIYQTALDGRYRGFTADAAELMSEIENGNGIGIVRAVRAMRELEMDIQGSADAIRRLGKSVDAARVNVWRMASRLDEAGMVTARDAGLLSL